MDGDHSLERCYQVTSDTLHAVFDALYDAARRARGHVVEAEHGHPGQGPLELPGVARDRRRRDARVLRAARFPRRCPASCSCPAVRATRRRPRTSTRSTPRARSRGSCRSRTGARCRHAALQAWKGADANIDRRPGRVQAPGRHERSRGRGQVLGRPRTGGFVELAALARRRVVRCAPWCNGSPRRGCTVGAEIVGEIGAGLCVLVGVTHDDAAGARGEARGEGREPADLRRRRGRDEPVGARHRRRRARRQPVHALRRHRARPAAELGRGGAARARRAADRGVRAPSSPRSACPSPPAGSGPTCRSRS